MRLHRKTWLAVAAAAVVLALLLAFVAEGDIAGEPLLHEMFKASRIVGKLAIKIADCVP